MATDQLRRRPWTERDLRLLRELYPDMLATTVAREIGRSVSSVYQKAIAQGLRKSAGFFASDLSGRVMRGKKDPRMTSSQFKPGVTPWNKGVRGSTGTQEGCRATQFKPGRAAHEASNYIPIGSLRVTKDGYLERKVSDNPGIAPARRWVAEHRLVWEAANGPIPAGRAVVFRPSMKTTDADSIKVEMLEMLTRAQLMQRNSYHTNYPPELRQLVQLRGALSRQINKHTQALEQT
jgi:hypothetical protein